MLVDEWESGFPCPRPNRRRQTKREMDLARRRREAEENQNKVKVESAKGSGGVQTDTRERPGKSGIYSRPRLGEKLEDSVLAILAHRVPGETAAVHNHIDARIEGLYEGQRGAEIE